MSLFPGDSRILGDLVGAAEITGLFSDQAYTRRMVEVEVALARVQGGLGVIPAKAAERISTAAATWDADLDRIAESTARHGIPTIELIRQLRELVGPDAGDFVHWGATSQDIMDTALVLQLRDASVILEQQIGAVVAQLADAAEQHRDTLMVGRTRSQAALPITFGLKVATWLEPLLRNRERLPQLRPRILVVQLGGGAGTLASLGSQADATRRALADELGLAVPTLPWHAQRDALGELAGWLSLVTGSLGKMARDIILMAQTEVGEVAESNEPSRGGSSTMPQKNNPVRSEAIVAAAHMNASLLSAVHRSLVHEHERDGAVWLLEALSLPQMVGLTGGALANAVDLTAELDVRPDRMRANVEQTQGLLSAEAASLHLARYMSRSEAKDLVRRASETVRATGGHLIEVLARDTDPAIDWSALRDEAAYLGAAGEWVDAVVRRARH